MTELARKVQLELKRLGYFLGTTGPNKDGVDGDPSDLTFTAALAELQKVQNPRLDTRAASPTVVASRFKLSKASKQKLEFLHPKLRQCVELAIGYSIVDFGVNQTIRTIEQQKKAVSGGNSRTMKSKHLKQPDGWVWAVDLVAYIAGAINWDLPNYAAIAAAMDRAATELDLADHIRWGCAWDRVLSDFGGDEKSYYAEILAYEKRHAGSDLLDGPHFEWVP